MMLRVVLLTAVLAIICPCSGRRQPGCSVYDKFTFIVGMCQSIPDNSNSVLFDDTMTGANLLEEVKSICRYRATGGPFLACIERGIRGCSDSDRATVLDAIKAASGVYCNGNEALPWLQRSLSDYSCEGACRVKARELAGPCYREFVKVNPKPSGNTADNIAFRNRLLSSINRCMTAGQTGSASSEASCSCSAEDLAFTYAISEWIDSAFLETLPAQPK